MATKKDLIEAQAFSRRRLLTAFTSGAPGGTELEPAKPLRAVVAGLALAAIVILAGVFYGLVRPGLPADWQNNALILVSDTGARYVSRDGTLHPVLNTASARLLMPAGEYRVISTDQSAIGGHPGRRHRRHRRGARRPARSGRPRVRRLDRACAGRRRDGALHRRAPARRADRRGDRRRARRRHLRRGRRHPVRGGCRRRRPDPARHRPRLLGDDRGGRSLAQPLHARHGPRAARRARRRDVGRGFPVPGRDDPASRGLGRGRALSRHRGRRVGPALAARPTSCTCWAPAPTSESRSTSGPAEIAELPNATESVGGADWPAEALAPLPAGETPLRPPRSR